MKIPRIILSSESPRRRQLLENCGLKFVVERPLVDEAHPEVSEVEVVTESNALHKAEAVFGRQKANDGVLVVGADTLVVLGSAVIAKPVDASDATRILSMLSGKTHRVVTGLALVSSPWGKVTFHENSFVKFRELSAEEIAAYVKLKEPYDKAGAYAIQGVSSLFIEKIDGLYTNVMGLPVERLLTEMAKLTGIPVTRFFESLDG